MKYISLTFALSSVLMVAEWSSVCGQTQEGAKPTKTPAGASNALPAASGSKAKTTTDDRKKQPLAIGDEAPGWKLTGSDGKEYKLSDYRGKQAVVLSWYPMALTGG